MPNALSSFTFAWVPGSSHAFLSLSLHFPNPGYHSPCLRNQNFVNELFWSFKWLAAIHSLESSTSSS